MKSSKDFKAKKDFKKGGQGKTILRKERRNVEHKELEEKINLCKEEIDANTIGVFDDFPLSNRTLKGLQEAGFTKPTDIQKDGISLALRGLDVLGAAKTGSGKTLAFLIPVLELLWHNKWSNMDGLGALIISPTRELALQIFEVLRKVGKHHDFSAGLIIGGKDVKEEQVRISNTNIIICTPGRLLQHFDETVNFHCDDLKILILDEADRILDLGFKATMNAIMDNLPEDRQTLLYSATQTKSIQDLARLSLNNPQYIAVHENSKFATPKKLKQNYVVMDIGDKLNFIYSFIKNHLKSKCIVFFSSCKEVKFVYETFRKFRPGILLLGLYGKQNQLKRIGIYNKFCNSQHAVMFATDIAARGLDFPAVNWVIQFDCPENTDTYIHRVGRTARYEKGGQALLMLLESETAIIDQLTEKKVPIHQIHPNPKRLRSIEGKLQGFCAENPEIKHWAQKSIMSYARSVHLQGDKTIFDVTKIDLEAMSRSFGLLAAPNIRFIKKLEKKMGRVESSSSSKPSKKGEASGKLGIEKLAGRLSNSDDEDDGEGKVDLDDEDNESDLDDILVKKESNFHHENLDTESIDKEDSEKKEKTKVMTKTQMAKKILRKKIKVNTKVTFNDNGGSVVEKKDDDGESSEVEVEQEAVIEAKIGEEFGGINVEEAKKRMKNEDRLDRQNERKRIRAKHKELKRKEREERIAMTTGSMVTLGGDINENESESDQDEVDEEKEEEEEIEEMQPKKKRRKFGKKLKEENIEELPKESTIAEDEELALRLLGVV